MLPGLFYTNLPHFVVCKTLSNIREDFARRKLLGYSEYASDCAESCREFHVATYLFFSYKLGKCVEGEFVDACLVSQNPKIRAGALGVAIKGLVRTGAGSRGSSPDSHTLRSLVERYVDDPFNQIRKLCLRTARVSRTALSDKCVFAAVRLLADENADVKIEAIKLLCKAKIKDRKKKADVSEILCSLIKDRCESVRQASARALKYFAFADLKDLFDKSANGVFVYGLEDECMSVRREAVKSIYFLCNESAKGDAFDFLVDLLNDDSEEIRILVSRVLRKLSKKFRWTISVEDLNLVILNLQEMSRQITTNLLGFCGNLVYTNETFYILFLMLDKVLLGKSVPELYRCMRRMAQGNQDLFFLNHNSIYQVNTKVQGREPSILDKGYLGRLLCLDVLRRKKYDIVFPDFFADHFRFLELKYPRSRDRRADFARMQARLSAALKSAIEHPKTFGMYRELFCKRGTLGDHELFFSHVYRAIYSLLSKKSTDMLEYVLCRFGLMRAGMSFGLDHLRLLLANIRYEDVRPVNFCITTPSIVSTAQGEYVDFRARIAGPTCGYFLRVHDPTRNLSIYYEAAEVTRVLLNEPQINVLVLCVVARGPRDVRMSPCVSVSIGKAQ